MRSELSLTVAICTVDRAPELKLCLESLAGQLSHIDECIVVLGPTNDNSAEIISHFSWARLIQINERNLSIARNIAWQSSNSEVVAFLDDDSRAEPDWALNIKNSFSNPDVGVVGGWIRGPNGDHYQVSEVSTDVLGRNIYSEKVYPPIWHGNRLKRIPRPTGANSAFRKEALLNAGGFDELYSWLFDEVEAAFRVQEHGWKYVGNEKAIVHHYPAASELRESDGIPKSLIKQAFSKTRFTVSRALGITNYSEINREIANYLIENRKYIRTVSSLGRIDEESLKRLESDLTEGIRLGFRSAISNLNSFSINPKNDCKEKPNTVVMAMVEWPSENSGGIGIWYQNMADELVKRNFNVWMVGPSRNNKYRRVYEGGIWKEYLPAFDVGINGGYVVPVPEYIKPYISPIQERICQLYKENNVAMTLVPSWGSIFVGLIGIPRVFVTLNTNLRQILELDNNNRKVNKIETELSKLEISALRKTQKIISVSRSIRSEYPDIPEESFTYIYPGIPDKFSEINEFSDSDKIITCKNKHVMFVGRAEPRKGFDFLLKMLSNSNLQAEKIGLIKIGPVTNYNYDTSKLVCCHNLGDVKEVDKFKLMRESFFVAIPSRYESFGIIAAECMMVGVPFLATKAGGLRELIGPLDNLIGFEIDNEQEFLEKFENLKDASFINKVVSLGRERYSENFSVETNLKKLLDLIDLA